jgi:hypothetical protein
MHLLPMPELQGRASERVSDGVLDLLNALGIDPRREDDVHDFGPREATWSEDYEHGRGSWRDWKWMYEGDFRAFGRVSRRHTHPGDTASKASPKYETRVGPFFSYQLYAGNVARPGPMLGSPFRDPGKTFVVTFMAEDVPWLLDGPPWDMPSESK